MSKIQKKPVPGIKKVNELIRRQVRMENAIQFITCFSAIAVVMKSNIQSSTSPTLYVFIRRLQFFS